MNAAVASWRAAAPMTSRTTGSMASGRLAISACTTAWRSATQGPSYNRRATSSKGSMSMGTGVRPVAGSWASASSYAAS